MNTLLICSGGLDSITLAYALADERNIRHLVSFDYGQRHKKELDFAAACAARLRVSHDVVDVSSLARVLRGSALTDDVAVPEGHYAEDSMKITIVPNRNAIMLTIAYGIASARGLSRVAAAVHAGDHYIYPDCRPAFVETFEGMQRCALDGVAEIALHTPFVRMTKAQIVEQGARLHVPFEQSWSCYKGGDLHCGRCGTCVERREAFDLAGVLDPTAYADAEYWRTAIAHKNKTRAA